MYHKVHRDIPFAVSLCCMVTVLAVLAACSTKENNARTRFWHSFTAKYNTMYNGNEAFKEGMEAQLKGNVDNYTQLIPVFTVGNEKSRSLGKSNFKTAIEKCEKAIQLHSIKKRPTVDAGKRKTEKMKQYLQRKEYNPYLKYSWLLMGEAQFYQGNFVEAASTFSYITRMYAAEPPVAAEARAWLARCYTELDWYYDAEDALQRLNRDSVSARLSRERDATMADLLLRQERFADAVPYLERAARHAGKKLQKARLYFLLGQVQNQLGHKTEAYKAFGKCIKQNPPYQLAFNARILQTEVLSDAHNSRRMISRLKAMARSDKNKDYQDQVYYAMGNIYLAQKDTLNAISSYEKGRAKSSRSGIEKGVLLLRLGELYWERQKYDKAQTCYTEALGMIDKNYKDFAAVTKRSKVLDKLVPYTNVVALQDSLQELSRMSESDRNAAIDRVIEALKKKEREEARARRDSAAAADAGDGVGGDDMAQIGGNSSTVKQNASQTWYFYNPMLVMQGKEDFRKRWGNRKNEDDWRRSNKTVLSYGAEEEEAELTDSAQAAQDSIAALEEKADTVVAPENDPHKREYYLKQIPFTEEAKQASNLLIMDGLYNAGIIEKDELEDFPLAASTLGRIVKQYPTFDRLQDTYYQLFMLYSRWGRTTEAGRYRDLMAEQFPDSTTTKLVLDPDYLVNARYGKQMEDSLYTETYNAYRNRDMALVDAGYSLSTEKYPNGANRPKFIFLHALSRIGRASNKEIADELRNLVKTYPKSDVSEMAGMIVNGLDAGRRPGTGGYDLGSLWDRRTAQVDSTAAAAGADAPKLVPDREGKFVFLVAYPKDSLNDNQLLFDIAHFNFTHFYLRNFDIEKVLDYGTGLLTLSSSAAADAKDKGAAAAKAGKDAKKGDADKGEKGTEKVPAAGGKKDMAALNKAAGKQTTHDDEERAAIAKVNKQGVQSIVEFRVKGFNSYDEAHAYAQDIYHDKDVARQLRHARVYLISERNLQMLGRQFSFADYEKFFEKTFAPMKINPDLPLDVESEPVEQKYEERTQPIYPLPVKTKADTTASDSVKSDSAVADSTAVPATDAAPVIEDEGEMYPAGDDVPAEKKDAEPVVSEEEDEDWYPAVPDGQPQQQEEKTEKDEAPAEPEKKEETPAKQETEPAKKEEEPAKKEEEPAKQETPAEPVKQEEKTPEKTEDETGKTEENTEEKKDEPQKEEEKTEEEDTEEETTEDEPQQGEEEDEDDGEWYPV